MLSGSSIDPGRWVYLSYLSAYIAQSNYKNHNTASSHQPIPSLSLSTGDLAHVLPYYSQRSTRWSVLQLFVSFYFFWFFFWGRGGGRTVCVGSSVGALVDRPLFAPPSVGNPAGSIYVTLTLIYPLGSSSIYPTTIITITPSKPAVWYLGTVVVVV